MSAELMRFTCESGPGHTEPVYVELRRGDQERHDATWELIKLRGIGCPVCSRGMKPGAPPRRAGAGHQVTP